MRIAHLNTSRIGGAALASLRYSQALKSIGLDNDLYALGRQEARNPEQVLSIIRTPLEEFQSKTLTVLQKQFLQNGSSLITPVSLEPKSVATVLGNYDLIHLHSTYNILNSRGLSRLINSGKEIVITLHDQRWFTGGCHYSASCENYKDGCKSCPQASMLGKLLVSRSFRIHERIWAINPKVKVITPSHWLCEKAQSSKLLSNLDIKVIRNPIPFHGKEGHGSIGSNNFSKKSHKKIVFVADNLQNPLKGLDVLLSALRDLTISEKEQIQLLLIGNNPPPTNIFPISTKTISITSSLELSGLLEQQDMLVVPSRQDNLPNVIGEAFSSGIKVVGSNVGGIPEVVSPEVGAIFQSENHHELANIIKDFDESYSREKVKAHFNTNFAYDVVGRQIANFYFE